MVLLITVRSRDADPGGTSLDMGRFER
jgi:hypothetical protein